MQTTMLLDSVAMPATTTRTAPTATMELKILEVKELPLEVVVEVVDVVAAVGGVVIEVGVVVGETITRRKAQKRTSLTTAATNRTNKLRHPHPEENCLELVYTARYSILSTPLSSLEDQVGLTNFALALCSIFK